MTIYNHKAAEGLCSALKRLDEEILQLNAQGFDTSQLGQAASLIVGWHNNTLVLADGQLDKPKVYVWREGNCWWFGFRESHGLKNRDSLDSIKEYAMSYCPGFEIIKGKPPTA